MRVYLMSRYGRRREMLLVAADLEAMGHTVTSRWIRGAHELQDAQMDADPALRVGIGARFAEEDMCDLNVSECAVAFTEEPHSAHSRGGRHVEAGIALCRHMTHEHDNSHAPMRLIVVGQRENVFFCLPCWEHFDNWPACREALTREVSR